MTKTLYKSLILVSAIFSFGFTLHAQDFWEIINTPDSIDVRALNVNANNDIFIGNAYTSGGGLYKSSDNGLFWELFGLYGTGIYTIEINELGYLFVHGGGDLLCSKDNGQSWENIYNWGGSEIDSKPGGLMFISGSTGSYINLLRSTDYGETWQEVAIYSNIEYVKAIEIKNSDTIYVGTIKFTGYGGGVYQSVDGGDSWEHIGLYEHYVSSLAINSKGDVFAGTRGHYSLGGGGVFVLPNGQQEWINLNNSELVTSIAINSANKIFIGCSSLDAYYGGVRCSSDDGQNWEDISHQSMHYYDIDGLVFGPGEYLYAFSQNSSTPLYKSLEPTTVSIYEQNTRQNITTYNYPNPFRDITSIYFSLNNTQTADVQMHIYNSLGKVIESCALSVKPGSEQLIEFNAKDLPAGVYYYTISAGNMHAFNKMLLRK